MPNGRDPNTKIADDYKDVLKYKNIVVNVGYVAGSNLYYQERVFSCSISPTAFQLAKDIKSPNVNWGATDYDYTPRIIAYTAPRTENFSEVNVWFKLDANDALYIGIQFNHYNSQQPRYVQIFGEY